MFLFISSFASRISALTMNRLREMFSLSHIAPGCDQFQGENLSKASPVVSLTRAVH